MKVRIVRADPTGNNTILVLSPVEPSGRAEAARRLMALDGGWAEQVGFLSAAGERPRLDMMGGEFCGNASMSAAAFLTSERGRSAAEVPLSVSGAPDTVLCSVRKTGEVWVCAVSMPLPESVRMEAFSFRDRTMPLWVVRFPGIVHVIVPRDRLAREEAETAVRQWADNTGAAALGLLLFSEEELEMTPLVYVRETDSAVWERGCASGTAAAGAFIALRTGGAARAAIRQPGGVITVAAAEDHGRVTALRIGGGVRLLGTAWPEI